MAPVNPGLRPGLSSVVPVRQAQGRLYGTFRFSNPYPGLRPARAVQISELFGSVGLILLDELQLQAGFAKPGWVATFAEFVGVAVVGAKTEALFPGRVPHVRPSVHGLKKMGRSPFERFCNAAKTLRPRESLPME